MKKFWGILVLVLMFCNVSFAECIKSNCSNGQGTYIYANGNKYVGEWKDGIWHGQGTYTETEGTVMKGIWKNGKLVKPN